MDITQQTQCIPHPTANVFLFAHKRTVLSVFRDVLGLFDIDHVSITCINANHEALFLSHTPSIEYNLLHSDLWQYDLSHHAHFYQGTNGMSWEALYHPQKANELHFLKCLRHQFVSGFSIPSQQDGLSLIYSFATKSQFENPSLLIEQADILTKIGQYCFNKLSHLFLHGTHAATLNKGATHDPSITSINKNALKGRLIATLTHPNYLRPTPP